MALAVVGLPEHIAEVVARWDTSDAPFARARQMGLPTAEALARLGIRLFTQERIAAALEVLQAAAALAPDDPALLTNLAIVLERSGDTGQAIAIVERSLALAAAPGDSWILLGNLKRKQGDLAGAQAAYEAALALEAICPLAWLGLGLIKQEQSQYPAAIACIGHCIEQSQASAPLLAILGQLFFATGQFEKSRGAYAAAVSADRQHPVHRQMQRETLFICAVFQGDAVGDALEIYERDRAAAPGTGDKDIRELLQMTFGLLNAHGHKQAAQRVAAHRVALFPTSATAAYQFQVIAGDCPLARAPDDYLVEYFNAFAGRFDQHLVQTLGYDIPRQLGAALAGLLPAGSRVDVVDAGCGTGLCGPHIRALAATLTGVDLAPAMLDHARRRQVYDRLVCAELTTFLANSPASYDVLLAADVLIYIGDLAPLAAASATALRPGGLLAVSIEQATTPGYELLSSGRFAHNPDYIHAIFAPHFTVCLCTPTTVRLEAAQPVAGHIFVLRRV